MRFSIIAIVTPLLLAGSAFAGYNCKCQDAGGQYNADTRYCCEQQKNYSTYHYGDAHQCAESNGGVNNGKFVDCCHGQGRGGAFCWN